MYIEATLHTAATLNESRLVPFITSVLSLTLAMTTITTGTHQSGSPLLTLKLLRLPCTHYTGLIVYRILQINNGIASQDITRVGGNRKLTRVVRILVESAALQLIVEIIVLAFYAAGLNAQYILLEMITPIVVRVPVPCRVMRSRN